MTALLWLVGVAMADCGAPYTHAEWTASLDGIEASLGQGDVDGARKNLAATHAQLQCLDSIAKADVVARFTRDLALAFFFDQDDDAVRRWALSSRYADATLPWDDAQFGEEHPFRTTVLAAEDPPIGGPTDKGLLTPKKGGVFANGRPLPTANAPAEVPLLIQVADAKGVILLEYWQDGAAFPATLLGPPVGPAPVPSWFTGGGSSAVAAVEPSKPEEVAQVEKPEQVAVVAPPKEAKVKEPKVKAAKPEVVAAVEPTKPAKVKEPKAKPTKPVTVAVADPTPETVATVGESEAVASIEPVEAINYIDPFADARRRAIAREVSERTFVTQSGEEATVRTEVLTFVADPSGGKPVSYAHYADWLKDFPEWRAGGSASKASGATYLSDWKDGVYPAAKADAPVVWVSYDAAKSYCGSWGNRVAQTGLPLSASLAREWRIDGEKALIVSASGPSAAATSTVAADLGFRCAP